MLFKLNIRKCLDFIRQGKADFGVSGIRDQQIHISIQLKGLDATFAIQSSRHFFFDLDMNTAQGLSIIRAQTLIKYPPLLAYGRYASTSQSGSGGTRSLCFWRWRWLSSSLVPQII